MKRSTHYLQAMLLLCIACCWFAGCGNAKQGQLPTAQVDGQITYRGQPLTRGTIKFIPAQTSGAGARVALGTIDGLGRYRLGTYEQADGAVPGDYQVSVESREDVAANSSRQPSKFDLVRATSLVPERYADPSKSGLTAHVAAESNTINFDLKD